MSVTKIADSTANVFKLLFFRLNPHFNSSDLIDTFFFLPFTKVPLTRFYSVRIKTTHKPSKEVAAKNFFSSVYVIGATCFDEFFFIPCDYWKAFIFLKACRFSKSFFEIFSTAILLFSMKEVFWKKSVFYIISAITIQR